MKFYESFHTYRGRQDGHRSIIQLSLTFARNGAIQRRPSFDEYGRIFQILHIPINFDVGGSKRNRVLKLPNSKEDNGSKILRDLLQ